MGSRWGLPLPSPQIPAPCRPPSQELHPPGEQMGLTGSSRRVLSTLTGIPPAQGADGGTSDLLSSRGLCLGLGWLMQSSHDHCPREGMGCLCHPGPQMHLTPSILPSWTLSPRFLPQGTYLS